MFSPNDQLTNVVEPPPAAGPAVRRFELFVVGATALGKRARKNLAEITGELDADLKVEVVDLIQSPQRAIASRIYVAPTLVECCDGQTRKLVGDLSDEDVVRDFLLHEA